MRRRSGTKQGSSWIATSEPAASPGHPFYERPNALPAQAGCRSGVSEPSRGRRRWKDRDAAREATHANRRRIRGERGKTLIRRRGELLGSTGLALPDGSVSHARAA
jgi:hypothetical protein